MRHGLYRTGDLLTLWVKGQLKTFIRTTAGQQEVWRWEHFAKRLMENTLNLERIIERKMREHIEKEEQDTAALDGVQEGKA